MSDEIILHRINTHQKIDDLIEDFYPEFCTPYKRNAIFEAIKGMNEHNGNVTRGFLPLGSWVLLPAYSSAAYGHIADQDVPSTGLSYVLATSPIHGVSHERDTQSALHQGMKTLGPQKMLSLADFTHDWYHEFKENLTESPQKDSLTELAHHVAEKGGEHGAALYVATRSLDQSLKRFGSATTREARQVAKQEVLSKFKEVQKEIPKVVSKLISHYADKRFVKPSYRRGLKALTNAGNAMHSATKLATSDTLVIGGAKYTKLLKIMRYGYFIAPGFLLIDIAVSTINVVGAYEKGENWQELAFREGGGILGAMAGGFAGEFAGGLSSGSTCGPCAVIAAPVVSIGGAILGEKAGEAAGKIIYKHIFE
ncbi:MAG: hypothetical protein V4591_10260 [Bdellovibrionota bacterium]